MQEKNKDSQISGKPQIQIEEKYNKPYDPQKVEDAIYEKWQKSGYFNPDNLPQGQQMLAGRNGGKDGADTTGASQRFTKPYTIVMPPPNANGDLHVGHSLFITLEDIMIRYKRMNGYKALWIPGADHAGFETQIVYERKLEKEGRSRFGMDPQALYKEIYDFTIHNKAKMEGQVRKMGASCDWSREKFTLDPDVVTTVQHTFKKMFDDGLVYRSNRMVNWCTKHQTSLSDVETETKEMNDKLYYLKYGPLTVATVRPETLFGDVALAVNPTDERYKHLIGSEIVVKTPIGEMTLKIVGDEIVEKEFGTGALKITPAHDKNDFELAQRHNLPSIEVIDKLGKLTAKTGKYAGLKIAVARDAVVKDLQAMGMIEKVESYTHPVPTCYKCNTTIEPRQMPQWYVKMKPLAELALGAVEKGELNFYPDNYRKIFNYWMSNTTDWNISRQIVWGIPIPAKICTNSACGHAFPDLESVSVAENGGNIAKTETKTGIEKCPKCGGGVTKDTDTFDTWFSSGQWPLITTGYVNDGTKNTPDFKTYYPTDVMETGYDLIFKWVPRMVIFGLYLNKHVPFKDVYLHGLVNDAQGKKMSKSKGNVINPLDMTAKYGTDALRMALVVGNPPGSDTALSENKIKGYKNFANKIWNVTRFVLMSTEGIKFDPKNADEKITTTDDKKILEEFNSMAKDVTSDFEGYRFHLAAEKLYHYVWHRFADEILEQSKAILAGANTDADAQAKLSRQNLLLKILRDSLIMLHPFMPFITEEIWASVNSVSNRENGSGNSDGDGDSKNESKMNEPKNEDLLIVAEWVK